MPVLRWATCRPSFKGWWPIARWANTITLLRIRRQALPGYCASRPSDGASAGCSPRRASIPVILREALNKFAALSMLALKVGAENLAAPVGFGFRCWLSLGCLHMESCRKRLEAEYTLT